jgi:hypothetical protein
MPSVKHGPIPLNGQKPISRTNIPIQARSSLSASIPVLPLYDNFASLEKSRIDLKKTEITEMQLQDNVSTLIRSYLYTLISGSKQLASSKVAVELASGDLYQC